MPATTLTRSPKMAPDFAEYRRNITLVDVFAAVAAVATFTEIAQASHVNGETFVLRDRAGVVVTFHYDVSGAYTPVGGYNATNVRLNISGATTASDVATIVRAAVNAAAIAITASGATDQMIFTQDVAGIGGNTVTDDTVANAGFLSPDFAGGQDAVAEEHGINMQGYENAHVSVIPSGGANPTVRVYYWDDIAEVWVQADAAVAGAGANTAYSFTVQCRSRIMFVAVTVLATGAVAINVAGSRLVDQPAA